jgi:serine/threonine-protein kinase PknK
MSPGDSVGSAGDGDVAITGYRDFEQIGQGGFGVVYRAWQERPGRYVAVKVLAVASGGKDAVDRFQREGEFTGRLTGHPNVVTVLDMGVVRSGRPYVVTEYYERGSLKRRLDEAGPLPLEEVLRIGVRIAGALAAAHEAGILHRDVKPQNILISRYGEPALADFGIARLLDAGEVSTQSSMLTPHHAAPEVLDGRQPSPATDTYALGSTLYQLLAGRSAFQGETDEGIAPVLRRIITDDPPEIPRSDVPSQVTAVIRRSMAKSPGERLGEPLALARELQRLQADLGYAVTDLPQSSGQSPASGSHRETASRAADQSPFEDTADRRERPLTNGGAQQDFTTASATVLRPHRTSAPKKPGGKNRSRPLVLISALAAVAIAGVGAAAFMGWGQSANSDRAPVAQTAAPAPVTGSAQQPESPTAIPSSSKSRRPKTTARTTVTAKPPGKPSNSRPAPAPGNPWSCFGGGGSSSAPTNGDGAATTKTPINLKTGNRSDCPNTGQVGAGETVFLYCSAKNEFNIRWWYVREAGTHESGWTSGDNLTIQPPPAGDDGGDGDLEFATCNR